MASSWPKAANLLSTWPDIHVHAIVDAQRGAEPLHRPQRRGVAFRPRCGLAAPLMEGLHQGPLGWAVRRPLADAAVAIEPPRPLRVVPGVSSEYL